jgi:hypothetical protein
LRKDRSRQILGTAIGLLGLAVLLFVLSLAIGDGLLLLVPYALLLGFGLLVWYAVVRPKPEAGSQSKGEPTFFGNDTTDFISRLDREVAEEDPTLPASHRGLRAPSMIWNERVFEDIEWRRLEAVRAALAEKVAPGQSQSIAALDGSVLLALISRLPAADQHALLAIAYEGEYWRPTCANCGVKMVEQSARATTGSSWSCVNFPRCQFTLPVRRPAH